MQRVLREDSNCIDVGCHVGSILKEMLRLAPRGRHFAFEPLPDLYQGLLQAFGNTANLTFYDYALSDTAGPATFQHVVSNPGYSGLRRRRYDRPHEELREITVRTNLLDALIPADVPVRFIKVDVEGGELQVFRGAAATIKRSRPYMVFEHGLGAADCYGTSPESVYDLLAGQCGLRLALMADWLQGDGDPALGREDFCEQFYRHHNYYFMAYPPPC